MRTIGRSASSLAVSLVAVLGGVLVGCIETDATVPGGEGASPAVTTGLDDDFAAAGAARGVPADLLEAIGHVETRWQMVSSDGEHDGQAGAHGVMALGGDRLAAAAALAEVDQADARTIAAVNIDAAAALLADAARRAQVAADAPLDAWAPAVAIYSGIDDEEARADYLRAVWAVLVSGAREVAESGEVVAELTARRDVTSRVGDGAGGQVAGPDYASALWRASPNFSSRPSARVAMVIIHTCEGNYAGCWGWLRNSASGVSAHYVVNESGSEVTQLVREASKAWHIAATYQCSRNSSVECGKNGTSSNNFTIGIEHGGFASQSSFPTGQIEASAKLVCDITRDQGIARDRNHIVGHGQLQPNNRVDPGPNWPWSHYIERVRALCGDGGGTTPTPGGEVIIVDSNNANNDAAKGRVELTGTWSSSNSIAGYYGSGYWYATSAEVSAPATFWFYAAAAGTRTIDAWWAASSNRATAVPFIAYDAAGREVGRATKNQTTQGSQWVSLGTWNFTAGWNKVVVSRWTTPGKMVIADAIRVR